MGKKILITGGTGLLGKVLSEELVEKGHTVSLLSRNPDKVEKYKAYYWNVKKQEIDEKCIDGIDIVIHLAGAGIADEKWTEERKKTIIDSRTKSIQLIYDLLKKKNSKVEAVISASAVGFYGDRGNEILTEQSESGSGFLSETCVAWENAVDCGSNVSQRIVKFRIGLPMTEEGGVLKPFKLMANTFSAMKFGDGQQWVPWIHVDDLVGMFAMAVENEEIKGVFNASAPTPVRNQEFVKDLAKTLKKPFWPFFVPKFALKLAMGERDELVLMSNRTDSTKIQNAGYHFKYTDLKKAFKDILDD